MDLENSKIFPKVVSRGLVGDAMMRIWVVGECENFFFGY
jgi:hypothetical protein